MTSIKQENCCFCGECVFLFFPPEMLSVMFRMFQAVDKSTEQLATYALNQQNEVHGGKPELYRLAMPSNTLKGSEPALTYE